MKKLLLIIRSIFKNSKLYSIVTLSMGLGLMTAGVILSYVYQEFHYDAGYKNSEHVYRIVGGGGDYGPAAETYKSNLPEIKEAVRVSYFWGYLACASGENKFNETSAIFADPEFFDLFSFPMVKGNSTSCLQDPNSVVISESAARKYFNNSNPIGQQLTLSTDQQFTVTAVFQNFNANSNFMGDLVFPMKACDHLTQMNIPSHWKYGGDLDTFVLLEPQTNLTDLAEKADNLIFPLAERELESHLFEPLINIHINERENLTYLYILISVALLILLVAGSNFIFLFVGIKAQQKTGAGIKKVCGASRFTLFIEYFAEVVLLMGVSVAVAVLLYAGYQTLAKDFLTILPTILYFDVKLLLLLFAVVSAVALFAGLYPALVLSSQMPIRIFRAAQTGMSGKVKFVNKLVVVQFALCISLMICTMIMHNQVKFMENRDTGYAKDELVTIPLNMHLGQGIYNDRYEAFTHELKKYAGIKNVTMSFNSPSSINNGCNEFDWDGKTEGKEFLISWESVTYDYFETIGVKMVQGRSFSRNFSTDMINWEDHTGAFIINQSAAKAMELDDPIGKEFRVWAFKGPIIGVVDDYNFQSMHSAITPMFFMVNPVFWNEIIVRINPNSKTALSDIKTVWDQFVPEYPLEFHFVSDKIKELYYSDKNLADSLNLFSVLAIIIAAMGLFALTILSTNQRVKEIGIRKVVGASVVHIVFLLSKEYLKLVAIANLIAWPIAWFAMRHFLQNFAYKIPLSMWLFLLSGGIALGIALLTVSFYAIKAATANPINSLRYE